jgi:hypothetical protein
LTDKSDIARQRERFCERRVQADVRQHHAYAIRSDDPHLPASFENLLFEFHPSRSRLFESGRDDHRAFNPGSRALGDNSWNRRCRRGDHSEVDALWYSPNC